MPKTFTESERNHIRQRLMEEAEQCLIRYGARKTTVDELVRRVNIPKGTFYLFYDSKELLFYEVLTEFHDQIHEKMRSEIASEDRDIDPIRLTELIFNLYRQVEGSFLLRFMTEGDLEMMLRKLPPETAAEHAAKDDFSVEQLLSMIPGLKADRVRVYSAALRGIFLSMLHRHEIGDEVFEDALKAMIHGIVIQMFEGVRT